MPGMSFDQRKSVLFIFLMKQGCFLQKSFWPFHTIYTEYQLTYTIMVKEEDTSKFCANKQVAKVRKMCVF